MKKLGEIAAVLVAVALTVANSAAPDVREDTQTYATTGAPELAIELDRRFYGDKGFEVRLPRGEHRSLVLERLPRPRKHGEPDAVPPQAWPAPGAPAPERSTPEDPVLLELKEGDPRLAGAPAWIEVLSPEAVRTLEQRGRFKLTLIEKDGRRASVEFGVGREERE